MSPSNFHPKFAILEKPWFLLASVNGPQKGDFDCFHTTEICVFWNLIVNAHLQLNFKIRKKHRVYAKTRREMRFEMRISNDGAEVFYRYDSRKSRNEVCVNDLTSESCFGGRS